MKEQFATTRMVLRAYLELLRFDVYIRRNDFPSLYRRVRNCPLHPKTASPGVAEQISRAVDWACVLYFKQVLCLERSAVTTCLLKAHGISAEMVIGARQIPFNAHAWVEVGGKVVNDKPYVSEMYAILDRC
jgi:Transglutaminase-like superfamily